MRQAFFPISAPADVVERILALLLKSELCRLVFGPTLAFGQGYPFANDLALCIFSEHGRLPDPRQDVLLLALLFKHQKDKFISC
jgi:hypothetical protein